MSVKIRFLGAAQNVTGSRHLLEANGVKVLVDCGLYQERQFQERNFQPLQVPPSQISAVLLTHGHLDHCGWLPKLVKDGFSGKIYCTNATAEIAKIILLDSAKIQEEDAEYKNKRHRKEGRTDKGPAVPLYTVEDAEAVFPYLSPVPYREVVPLGDGFEATLYNAGHVLGSSIIRVKVAEEGREKIIIFTGDIGRSGRPIICDPTVFDEADYVLTESTYGDRVHHPTEDTKSMIAKVINDTKNAGGKIIVPSFALERSQEILYYLNELLIEDKIPHIKVFLDSPMASKITKVFKDHPEMYDKDMKSLMKNHQSPFEFPGLTTALTTDESKALNQISDTVMIIAGSGMCTGGRIKHHLANNIEDARNTIMFVGYQAVGTLGRTILEGKEQVRILGVERAVKAKVVKVNGFSAHADKVELVDWLKNLKKGPRKIFVVHGEEKSAKSFAEFGHKETGWDFVVPEYGQEVELD